VVVDHVVLGVQDPQETARRFENAYGLRAVEGVRFDGDPGFGNWLVPLGSAYVELLAVVDSSAGDRNAIRGFRSLVKQGDRWLGWAIHTPELEALAERLGLPISRRSLRYVSDGRRFTWDLLAFEERLLDPYLPFFLRWQEPRAHDELVERLTDETGNRHVTDGIAGLELSGDPQRLRDWVAGAEIPAAITGGDPGIRGVTLNRPGVVLR
jgi:catechol 2,3-dioxygenase-like lactoylglutathione lyase family enzyme